MNRNSEPRWVSIARSLIGLKEIPGPRHEARIVGFWQRLRVTWFRDDETAWCGAFVGYCVAEAGLKVLPPAEVGRAGAWATWGVAARPQVGAIGVKKRKGGNHVFIIVGETPDRRFYKALGGNQSNQVSIVDIAKSDTFAIRWPSDQAQSMIALPTLPAGTVSRNEA